MTRMEAAFKQHPVWASVPPAHQPQAVEVKHDLEVSSLLSSNNCLKAHFHEHFELIMIQCLVRAWRST